MKLHKGNMWTVFDESDYFIFTGNSYIKKNGELVMGRGMALQVRNKFPYIAKSFGTKILDKGDKYGLLFSRNIGVFQVKYNYSDSADLDLIGYSTAMLAYFAGTHKIKHIHMNYPGIGYGHLKKKDVQPIIEELPDNVHIWTF